jgi:hypothetical protein
MSAWHGLAAFLLGAALAFAGMAFVAWADRPRQEGKRRLGSLTSVDEGREG